MRKIWVVIFAGLLWCAGSSSWPQTALSEISGSIGNLNDSQWKSAVTQFEESVSSLSGWLEECQTEMKGLQGDIRDLEGKIAHLREQTQSGSGVLDEIRLKGLLNDLKEKLEKNADLQHRWDEKQKEFEQKAMSLVALYNSRIDTDLQATDLSSQSSQLNLTLNELVLLIQKRNQTLALLKRYQKKSENENPLPLTSFGVRKFDDREGLLLTLDLIQDRKKALEEQLEKWSIEEDEVKNELKLQVKMKEFMDDIERMNEDSSFPHSSLKRSDLGDVGGDKERQRLQDRLEDLQKLSTNGQTSMSQLDELMEKVQNHLNTLEKKEGK